MTPNDWTPTDAALLVLWAAGEVVLGLWATGVIGS